MAITITEPVAELVSTANASNYALGAFTPTANSLLIVIVFATATVAAGSITPTNGIAWTKLSSSTYNSGADTAYIFAGQVPGAVASTTITFDCTGDNASGAVVMAFQVIGQDGAYVRQVVTNGTGGPNPVVTFPLPLNTNNGYCAGFGEPRTSPGSAGNSMPSGWTLTCNSGYGTPTAGATGGFRNSGESSISIQFTANSGAYGAAGVEIWASGNIPSIDPMGGSGIFGL